MPVTDSTYDAIVVGSGASGSWAAKELTEGGLKVVLLEAGRNLDLSHDFPAEAEVGGMGPVELVKSAIKGQPVQARCGAFSETTKDFFVSDKENPYTTAQGEKFLWIRGRQLGGRLHTWLRHTPRMSNYELKAASTRGDGVDWPLAYEDLAAYYDIVERTLGVYGEPAAIPNCPDGQFIGPPRTTKIEERFRTNLEKNLPTVHVTYARKMKYDSKRVPLPIRLALTTGRLDIRADAVVSRLLIDAKSGKATGVEYVERLTGKTQTVGGKVVVLCASAIESVRILLNSKSATHPSGVGGSSGQLGRYVCDHVGYGLLGKLLETDAEAGMELGAGIYIPSFCENEPKDFAGGYGVEASIGRRSPTWAIWAFGEMQPRYENNVSLDLAVKDAWGIPVAKIDCRHSQDEINMVAHMKRTLPEIATAGGLRLHESTRAKKFAFRLLRPLYFTKYGSLWPGQAIHESGGARMGESPETSVLNSYNQCWDAENVFVTDASCFVSNGFQNPTLTVMALTVRACHFIIRDYLKV